MTVCSKAGTMVAAMAARWERGSVESWDNSMADMTAYWRAAEKAVRWASSMVDLRERMMAGKMAVEKAALMVTLTAE